MTLTMFEDGPADPDRPWAYRDSGHGTEDATEQPLDDVLAEVARDERNGTFYVTEDGPGVQILVWSGDNARRAHAALARALERAGIEATDVPGVGVAVKR